MSRLILPPTPWTKQPQCPVTIDKNNPLSVGLIFCAIPVGNTFLDLVSGQSGIPQGSGAATSIARKTIDGNLAESVELKGVDTSSRFAWPQYSTKLDTLTGNFSVFVEGSLNTNGVARDIISSSSSSTGNGFSMRFDDVETATNGLKYWSNLSNRVGSSFDILGSNSEQYKHRVAMTLDGTNLRWYAKNKLQDTKAETNLPLAGTNRTTRINGRYDSYSPTSCSIALAWDRVLTLEEYQRLYFNPWQVFQPISRNIWVPSAGGATTHATTGTLTGQGATVAGSAAHIAIHGTTGALVGQGATVAGTAARTRQHATDGVLVGQGATVAGSAARAGAVEHTTTGALIGQGATVAGTAVYNAKHTTTGTLTGQGATVSGSATLNKVHATSGALVGDGATVTGIAVNGTAVATQTAGGGGSAKKRKYTKKQKVWLVEVDDKEYEVEDLEEIQPIVAKKLKKGKTPEVKAKPLVEDKREAGQVYTQQAWLTEYVPIPAYEKRLNFVDILPYILAMQEMDEEEELLLMAA